MLSISKKNTLVIVVLFFVFFSVSLSYGQLSFDYKNSDCGIYASSNELILTSLSYANQDTSKLSQEQRIELYEKEKKNRVAAMILNYISGPLVIGHYYAGEPKRAIQWHIGWIVGVGSAALAIEKQSDFWGYFGAGVLAYTIVYQIIDAGKAVDCHNMKIRKKYDIVLNLQNKNNIEAKLMFSYHF